MRHRLGYNHLSRPTAHRMSMLRNLVSSLLQHEQITTTLAKAKATQRVAERVIEWGKNGRLNDWNRANAFLWNASTTLRPLFTSLAERYASRPGGYTRLIRSGHRVGDHAPLAILELVDNRNDLKFETASKSLARELALRASEDGPDVWWALRTKLEAFGEQGIFDQFKNEQTIEPITKKNVLKALRYRKPFTPLTLDPTLTEQTTTAALIHPAVQFLNRTHHHYLHHLASLQLSTPFTPSSHKTIKQLTQRLRPSESRGPPRPVLTVPMIGRRVAAGQSTRAWAKQHQHQPPSNPSSSLDRLERSLSGLDLAEANRSEEGGPISRTKARRSSDPKSPTRASSTAASTEAGL